MSTDFVILSNPDTYFYAMIYDDKGLNGMPGKLLDSVLVPVSDIQLLHQTVVPVSNKIVLYSGGVYVAWIMRGDNITLGVDETPPFSKQTFEDLSGAFAQSRYSETMDFFIGLNIEKSGIEDIGVNSIVSPKANA